ncbi:MacB family efflux pump subunit [Breoghania sp.]|uniref:MacB family efflux pump subunit n=1 Tax=Breoghania sp. TaxID=2065378 RepID=UPI0026089C8B|nr:MacB family efflux pump subunit [Breoghania sp.]MDJ0932829.1 MacB family efflux pump subunit [Breoghania sp.]
MAEPLIQLNKLVRQFPAGEGMLTVLDDVDLTIEAGEFVAIIGASGSGKSTLMNILGCLDRLSAGSYLISGRETSQLEPDELAALRREHFGFIFQRYHLLSELNALSNTEIPAIYAGMAPGPRQARAAALLGRLGMSERLDHRPGQLSGGQQQRVSIARAMMNGADVILADEPTGALDTHSSEEVLRILCELHDAGKTVIIVTHDPSVAAEAERTIEISDGRIVSDERTAPAGDKERKGSAPAEERNGFQRISSWRAQVDRFREAFKMALRSMNAHKVRTFLTMLGIIIGIASVVSVVALGTGSQQKVLANISSLGTNTLEIFPGKDFGDTRSGKITTLVVSDANQLAKQPYVAAVTPTVTTTDTVRFGATEANAQINGVGAQYFEAKETKLAQGSFFDADAVRDITQETVIDENTRKTLFADEEGSPIGRVILVGNVFCRIIGVTEQQQGGFGASNRLSIYLPYTTVQARFLGDQTLRSITVRVAEDTDTDMAEQLVTSFLTQRHGTKDFFILNTDDIRETITSTTQTLALLIAAIAVISLMVGGIGVMNIMLVSVFERVSEIGVRMAVGARRSDILQQFLIEAVLVCLIGGVLGIGTALGFGYLFSLLGSSFSLVYSTSSIVAAFLSSSLIGIAFGFLPARNASRLDPVVALSRD